MAQRHKLAINPVPFAFNRSPNACKILPFVDGRIFGVDKSLYGSVV